MIVKSVLRQWVHLESFSRAFKIFTTIHSTRCTYLPTRATKILHAITSSQSPKLETWQTNLLQLEIVSYKNQTKLDLTLLTILSLTSTGSLLHSPGLSKRSPCLPGEAKVTAVVVSPGPRWRISTEDTHVYCACNAWAVPSLQLPWNFSFGVQKIIYFYYLFSITNT